MGPPPTGFSLAADDHDDDRYPAAASRPRSSTPTATRPIEHGALHKPLHVSVAYGYRDARDLAAVFQGRQPGYAYGRQGNPTSSALEAKVNAMEGGVATVALRHRHGRDRRRAARARARGRPRRSRAATCSATPRACSARSSRTAASVSYVDATDADAVEAAITPRTRLVFVETIANPRTQVADLARIGEVCARHGLVYVVDNTLTSPWLFRPIDGRREPVVNALTKSIGGHGNALGGSVTDTGRYDWTALPQHPRQLQGRGPEALGDHADPQEGTARLGRHAVRRAGAPPVGRRGDARAAHGSPMRQCARARAIPGVASARARGPLSGACRRTRSTTARARCSARYGALLSFELADDVDPFAFLNRLAIVVLSSNLGDNRTLAIPVAQTIFWEMGAERRAAMGIAESLIRVSVGIEDEADLIADVTQALEALTPPQRCPSGPAEGPPRASGEPAPPAAAGDAARARTGSSRPSGPGRRPRCPSASRRSRRSAGRACPRRSPTATATPPGRRGSHRARGPAATRWRHIGAATSTPITAT